MGGRGVKVQARRFLVGECDVLRLCVVEVTVVHLESM